MLVRAFLALSNLMGDGGDAGAYGLQVAQKQEEIIQNGRDETGENPKLAYKRVALGAYIQGALQEESQLNYDDAARNWAKVCSWEPGFAEGPRDLERAAHGHHSRPGNGVLYVFTLVGRGPYKEETVELPSTVSLLIADRIISHNAEHTLPPNIAPIKVPRVIVSVNRIRAVGVSVDGRPAGTTETITDVGQLAAEQYEADLPAGDRPGRGPPRGQEGDRLRRKEAAGVSNNSLLNLAMDVGGVVWEATESADTRCWGLLPDRIQVLRIELPAGQHRVGLQPAGRYSALGPEQAANVAIEDGRNTYVLACFPDAQLVGRILTSRPVGQAASLPASRRLAIGANTPANRRLPPAATTVRCVPRRRSLCYTPLFAQPRGRPMTHADRLARQMEFILEIDKLKQVLRQTSLADGSRRENDAEHSWHLAVMAVLLAEYAAEPQLDLARVVKMLLVHDVVEIDAGDTYHYDEAGNRDKAEREQAAADRLFALLPADQEAELRGLWEEFEARQTPEARYAAALDRFQPNLLNYRTQGRLWREHGVTSAQVIARNCHMAEGAPALWQYAESLIHDAVAKGYLEE